MFRRGKLFGLHGSWNYDFPSFQKMFKSGFSNVHVTFEMLKCSEEVMFINFPISNVMLKCSSEGMFINFQFSNVVLKCSSEVMSEEPHFPAQATARVIVMVEKMREKSKKNLKDITGTKKFQ